MAGVRMVVRLRELTIRCKILAEVRVVLELRPVLDSQLRLWARRLMAAS